MKAIILILGLSFFFSFSFSQNLVPNPSFEQYSACPYTLGQINYAAPWFQPNNINGSSTDYYNACALVSSNVSIPGNWLGYQYAKTGVAYSGFSPFYHQNDDSPPPLPGIREYLEIQLSSSLIGGEKYNVSFYVSVADKVRYAIDALGVYFSKTSVLSSDYVTLVQYQPQVLNAKGNVITDTMNWAPISGSFVANGGELFMTIGNFKSDSATTIVVNNPVSGHYYAYYYIDDVAVMEDTEDGIIEDGGWKMDDEIGVYPNPVANECRVVCAGCKGEESQLSILNSLGQVVHQTKLTSIEQTLDVSFLEAGVYFVAVASNKKNYYAKLIKE